LNVTFDAVSDKTRNAVRLQHQSFLEIGAEDTQKHGQGVEYNNDKEGYEQKTMGP